MVEANLRVANLYGTHDTTSGAVGSIMMDLACIDELGTVDGTACLIGIVPCELATIDAATGTKEGATTEQAHILDAGVVDKLAILNHAIVQISRTAIEFGPAVLEGNAADNLVVTGTVVTQDLLEVLPVENGGVHLEVTLGEVEIGRFVTFEAAVDIDELRQEEGRET